MTLSNFESLPQRVLERCIPVLETERLVLRAPRLADAKAIARLAERSPHRGEYRAYSASLSVWRTPSNFLPTVNRQDGKATFAIVLKGEIIGMCGVEPREAAAEIGYWLGVPYWNRGYGTEAVRAVIDHAFGDLAHDALQAGARVSNPASRRVLEKCGFQWTGVGLYRIRAIKSSAPLDRFRLDRGLWASLKAWGRVKRWRNSDLAPPHDVTVPRFARRQRTARACRPKPGRNAPADSTADRGPSFPSLGSGRGHD